MYYWLFRRFFIRRIISQWPGTLLILSGLAISVSVLIAVLFASAHSVDSFQRSVASFSGDDRITLKSRTGELSLQELTPLSQSLAHSFELFSFLERQAELKIGEELLPITLLGVEGSDFSFRALPKAQESLQSVYLPRRNADYFGLRNGEVIVLILEGKRFQFSLQIIDDFQSTLPSSTFLMGLGDLQHLTQSSDRLSSLGLKARNTQTNTPKLLQDLRTFFSSELPYNQSLYLEFEQERAETASKLFATFRHNILIMVLMAFLVSGFTIFNAAQLSMLRLAPEIAILKTLGVSSSRIVFLLSIESIFLGVAGAFLGATLGFPLSELAAKVFLGTVSSLYTGQRNGASDFAPDATVYALSFVAAIVVCLMGTLWPSLKTLRIAPAIASKGILQEEQARSRLPWLTYLSLVLLCVGFAFFSLRFNASWLAHLSALFLVLFLIVASAPALRGMSRLFRSQSGHLGLIGILAQANLTTSRATGSVAVASSAVGVSLLLGLGIMISSFRSTLNVWTAQTFKADMFIKLVDEGSNELPKFLDSKLVSTLVNNSRVAASARAGDFLGQYREKPVMFLGFDLDIALRYSNYQILSGHFNAEELIALKSGKSVLVSESFAQKFGTGAGEQLRLDGVSYSIVAVVKDFTSDLGTVIFDFDYFAKRYSRPGVERISLHLKEPSASENVRAEIMLQSPANVLRVTSNAELRKLVLEIFDNTFLITRVINVLVVIICSLGFLVTLIQLSWERRRELRTMQVLGTSSRRSAQALLIESAILSIPGLLLGISGGIGLSIVLVYCINPLSFGWSLNLEIGLYDVVITPMLFLAATLASGSLLSLTLKHIQSNAMLSDE